MENFEGNALSLSSSLLEVEEEEDMTKKTKPHSLIFTPRHCHEKSVSREGQNLHGSGSTSRYNRQIRRMPSASSALKMSTMVFLALWACLNAIFEEIM
jgi:hypothetical protein